MRDSHRKKGQQEPLFKRWSGVSSSSCFICLTPRRDRERLLAPGKEQPRWRNEGVCSSYSSTLLARPPLTLITARDSGFPLSLSACIPVGASGLSDWGAPTKKKGLLLSLLRVCVYYALLSQTHIYWGAVVGFRLQLSFRHVPWKLFYSWIITILNHNNVCVVASCRVVQYHWWFGCKDGFCRHSSSRWT